MTTTTTRTPREIAVDLNNDQRRALKSASDGKARPLTFYSSLQGLNLIFTPAQFGAARLTALGEQVASALAAIEADTTATADGEDINPPDEAPRPDMQEPPLDELDTDAAPVESDAPIDLHHADDAPIEPPTDTPTAPTSGGSPDPQAIIAELRAQNDKLRQELLASATALQIKLAGDFKATGQIGVLQAMDRQWKTLRSQLNPLERRIVELQGLLDQANRRAESAPPADTTDWAAKITAMQTSITAAEDRALEAEAKLNTKTTEAFRLKQELDRQAAQLAEAATRRAEHAENALSKLQHTAQQWRAEHAEAIKQLEALTAQLDRTTGAPSGHIILKDATTADLDRLAAQHRPLILTQFVGDALYIVAGPLAQPQPQPHKPQTDHIAETIKMVLPEDEAVIDDTDDLPDAVEQPVFIFDAADPDLVGMMRAGVPAADIITTLNEENARAARRTFDSYKNHHQYRPITHFTRRLPGNA